MNEYLTCLEVNICDQSVRLQDLPNALAIRSPGLKIRVLSAISPKCNVLLKYEMVFEEEDELRTVVTESTVCDEVDLKEREEDEDMMST